VIESTSAWDGGPLGALRLLALVALLAAVIVGGVYGAGAFFQNGPRTATPVSGPVDLQDLLKDKAVTWKTERVLFGADAVTIDPGGRIFRATTAETKVHSDPGSLSAWTLEAVWMDETIEQRINLSFASDGATWWIEQLGVYDGSPKPDWAKFPAISMAHVPIGTPLQGTIDATGMGQAGPVRLTITGAVIAVSPQPNFVEPPGGAIPVNGDPFEVGAALHCSGILQMPPQRAESILLGLGYRLSWRLNRKTGPNTGFAELSLKAPVDGWISNAAIGSSGELILFVQDPKAPELPAATVPPDCVKPG
jgi:hypothetical protein